jgi:predicted transcriptional regulator
VLQAAPPDGAGPAEIANMLGRDPTNSNHVAVSKAIKRLLDRGLIAKLERGAYVSK